MATIVAMVGSGGGGGRFDVSHGGGGGDGHSVGSNNDCGDVNSNRLLW